MTTIQFGIFSKEVIKGSSILISSIKDDLHNTVKDPRLGEIKNILCGTCHESKSSGCSGHFGKLSLGQEKYINPAFSPYLNIILKYICYPGKHLKNPRLLELANLIENSKDKKEIAELKYEFLKLLGNKTSTKCHNLNCKISSLLKITKNYEIRVRYQEDKKNHSVYCSNNEIYDILLGIYKPFVKLYLNANNYECSFTDLMISDFYYIPSNDVREPNHYEDMSYNVYTGDLNMLVSLAKGDKPRELQQQIAKIDNDKNKPPYKSTLSVATLSYHANGTNKDGILRQCVFGRRTDGSARSVLGPDTTNRIGIITISDIIMNGLTYRIYNNKVTRTYVNILLSDVKKYQVVKIGFRAKVPYETDTIIHISPNRKLEFLPVLKDGDYLEIVKPDGTFLTFNRQPSLHMYNIQSAVAYRNKTFTIKIPVTIEASMNADNDGDECSTTNPLGPYANIELSFMNSRNIASNPADGSIVYGLVQDQMIAIHNIYEMYDIKRADAYSLVGKYLDSFIKGVEDKEFYTGRELLSAFLPKNLTFLPYFDSGILSLPSITTSHLLARSPTSIFTIASKLIGVYRSVSLIDIYQHIAQNYTTVYGYSARASEILGLQNNFNDNNRIVRHYVSQINNKINNFLEDCKIGVAKSFSYDDIEYIKKNNIYILQNILLSIINSTPDPNPSLSAMSNTGYKRTKDEIIKLNYTYGQQGNIQKPSINGRINHFCIPGSMSLEDSGYVVNSLIKGLNYAEHSNHINFSARPKLIKGTCEAGTAGTLGKKTVKEMSDLIVTDEGMISYYDIIIMPSANFLKINGSDIVRVNILPPDGIIENTWDEKQLEVYNNIKPYLTYNNKSQLIKQLYFFINIDGEIQTFNKKYHYEPLPTTEGLDRILEFESQYNIYYLYLIDTNFILYTLLSYLNPRRIHLSNELLDYIFGKILYLLRYSLEPGTAIGFIYSTAIQEVITQEILSAFHPVTKSGRMIKGSLERMIECLTLSNQNKPDLVLCRSEDYNKLLSYRSVFEFVCLYQLSPGYKILVEPDHRGYQKVELSISHISLQLKNIEVSHIYQIIKDVLYSMTLINGFSINIDITDSDAIIIIETFLKPNFTTNSILFGFCLMANSCKGIAINQNLTITKGIMYDDNLEEKTVYEIQFYITNIKDLLNIDTRGVILDLGIWNTFRALGTFHTKMAILNKILEIGDLNLFNPYFLLVSKMCLHSSPLGINKVRDKKHVVKNVAHGDSSGFAYAAVFNTVDPCLDHYSNIMISNKIRSGTGYYDIFVNPNNFDNLKYREEEEHKEFDEEIISFA